MTNKIKPENTLGKASDLVSVYYPQGQVATTISRVFPEVFNTFIAPVLVRVSIAMKRHHDHNNSSKGKHLIG